MFIFADSGEDHDAYLGFFASLDESYARKKYNSKVLSQKTYWDKMDWDSKGLSFFVTISCIEFHHLFCQLAISKNTFFLITLKCMQ